MASINKVGHVVLGCRDPEVSIKFYSEVLGMEVVNYFDNMKMAFFSFGTQHHDIAVVKVPDDEPVGSSGLSHTALQIDGGPEELAQLHQRLLDHDVKVDFTTDHNITKSVYFFDPDGNRLEIFSESMEMADSKKFLNEVKDPSQLRAPLDLKAAAKS